jgi:multimeric flavodoxin WrbA
MGIEVKYGRELEDVSKFIDTLGAMKKVVFVTTSSRSPYVEEFGESPKSSQLAKSLAKALINRNVSVEIIDGAKLKIHNCLGCVSEVHGNHCGVKESKVKDEMKNPNDLLRCWASHDFEDDELWKISKSIYESQAVIFFGSQRWGSVNAIYQKIIERLDWMENMHTTLGERNSISEIHSGLILIGQNWRVQESLELQKEVLGLFGFKQNEDLYLGWQFTRDMSDENKGSYKDAPSAFGDSWNIDVYRWEKEAGTELEVEQKTDESKQHVRDFTSFLEAIKFL